MSFQTQKEVTMILDLTTRAFLDMFGEPDATNLSVASARRQQSEMQAVPVETIHVDISDRTLPGGPTGEIPIRILRPLGVSDALPAIVYFHGGGWVVGGKDTHDRLVREIVRGSGAAIVF